MGVDPHPSASDTERLVAHDGIRQLVARYALAVDSRDLDALTSLFVADVQVGRHSRGREALRAEFERSLGEIGISILHVGTHVIDLESSFQASGWLYCHAEIQHGSRWIRQAILYRDTYRRDEGSWLFVRRIHRLWYGADPGVNPLSLEPANWPERHDGLGTVPECWDTWRQFWAAQGSLPGAGERPL